ncbi:hypothetical protein BMS3Abin02_00250 [bacterium BMS3Abin02]|nr:hypothetical protein BMS3Abin02_00250 [bacterium BMS3Abin02]GBE22444.1 hypothetical protein BMS3Bbin01_01819 [bacterium BMS3Bbin01]
MRVASPLRLSKAKSSPSSENVSPTPHDDDRGPVVVGGAGEEVVVAVVALVAGVLPGEDTQAEAMSETATNAMSLRTPEG